MYDNRQQQFYLTKISFETKERLPTFEACSGYFVKIIRLMDTMKYSIKICASSILKTLAIFFRNCLESKYFLAKR